MASKVKPAENTMDMDFLDDMDTTIAEQTAKPVEPASPAPAATVIDTVSMEIKDASDSVEEDVDTMSLSKGIKATQIVVRTTEKERDAMKAYFMKHGVSLSKGIKIAIKYLEQQEKKGQVHFSDIGLY